MVGQGRKYKVYHLLINSWHLMTLAIKDLELKLFFFFFKDPSLYWINGKVILAAAVVVE